MMLLKIVEINFFIHLKIDVCVIKNLSKWKKNEVKTFTITHGYRSFKFEFHGLKKTICTKNASKFDELVKLTIKTDSGLSHINISYDLKVPIPKTHRDFFRNNVTKTRIYEKCLD